MQIFVEIKDYILKHQFLSLIAITAIGLGLRLINLGIEPYWGDEILSLDIATHFTSIKEMMTYLKFVEFHPPLYYILVHYWAEWFGTGEFAIRMLSVIFGVATIPLAWYFAREIFDNKKIALLTALILAVLPMQIEYSQDARPYAIFVFFGLVDCIVLWKYLITPKAWYLIIYLVSAIIGLYLHYSFGFILLANSVWWFYQIAVSNGQKSRQLINWLSVHTAIMLGFAYWLPALLYKIDLSNQVLYGLSRHFFPIRESHFFESVTNQVLWLNKVQRMNQLIILIAFAAKLLIIGGGVMLIKKATGNMTADWKKKFTFLAFLIVIPAVLFLFSPFSVAYTDIKVRHLLFITIPLVMGIAYILARLTPKTGIVVALVFLLSLAPYSSEIIANDGEWDSQHAIGETASVINELYQPGDLVIIVSSPGRTNLNHYLRPELAAVPMMPLEYYGGDFGSTRQTLGFVENEYQTRIQKTDSQSVSVKLDRIMKIYQPRRVWLAGFLPTDWHVHQWFTEKNWRHGFRPVGEKIYLDSYTNPNAL